MAKKSSLSPRRVLRLLPLTVTMLSLLLLIKVNELYFNSQKLRQFYAVRDAVAEEKKEAANGEEKKAEAGHSDAKEEKKEDGHGDENKSESEHGEEKKEEAGHGEEKKEGEQGGGDDGHGGGSKPVEEPKTHGTGKSTVKEIEALKAREAHPQFTKTEIDILQNLSKRRDELDARERDLELKAKVLEATDKRIADKMNEMKTLQAELSKVIAQYNEKQEGQLKSLVKIYESMKPDEAAKIFNEMEMPILLDVIGRMSERKVAPVLANMSPKKAKDVTQELAEKRRKAAKAAADSAPAASALVKP